MQIPHQSQWHGLNRPELSRTCLDGGKWHLASQAHRHSFQAPDQSLNQSKQHWYTRRYSTGSGSDRVPPSKRLLCKVPGRYRSRYCTNVAWFDLESPFHAYPADDKFLPYFLSPEYIACRIQWRD